MLAKQIHFVWFGPPLPVWARANIETFARHNPEHTITLHSDAAWLLPELEDAFDRATTIGQQSDLMRYSVLQRTGGWYFDLDCICYRPLDGLEALYDIGDRVFLVRYKPSRKHLNTAILAGPPDSPTWALINAAAIVADPKTHSSAYGPVLCRHIAREHPDAFCIGGPGDFGEPHDWNTQPDFEPGSEPYVYHIGLAECQTRPGIRRGITPPAPGQ